MAYFTDPSPAVGAPGEIHTTQKNELLAERKASDGNTYIYLQGVASTASGDWVHYDEAGVTARAVANGKGPLAIATAATVASTYGWYCVKSKSVQANVLAAYADNAIPYLTSTDGSADDTVVSGDLITNAIARSAISNGQAAFQIDHPFTTDTLS